MATQIQQDPSKPRGPMTWLAAIRDHPRKPPTEQCHALTMLVLRLDWKTLNGHCGTVQLQADTDAGRSTVLRALGWAKREGFLTQTRRGHRLGNGQKIASEWALSIPQADGQGVSRDTLSEMDGAASRCQPGDLEAPQGVNGSPQGVSGEPPSSLDIQTPSLKASSLGEASPPGDEFVSDDSLIFVEMSSHRAAIAGDGTSPGPAPDAVANAPAPDQSQVLPAPRPVPTKEQIAEAEARVAASVAAAREQGHAWEKRWDALDGPAQEPQEDPASARERVREARMAELLSQPGAIQVPAGEDQEPVAEV